MNSLSIYEEIYEEAFKSDYDKVLELISTIKYTIKDEEYAWIEAMIKQPIYEDYKYAKLNKYTYELNKIKEVVNSLKTFLPEKYRYDYDILIDTYLSTR